MKCPTCHREGYAPRGTYPNGERPDGRRFIRVGEFRTPRKGDWYLSGAIPAAYMARANLTTPYHILKERPS